MSHDPLVQMAYCFEVTAGSCRSQLYFTASEKENWRTERKQNYVIKYEKEKILWLLLLGQQKSDRSSLVFSNKLGSLL